jgi:hypothetical protein
MATQAANEFDQRAEAPQAPIRETPDFKAVAQQFGKWSPDDLQTLWERNDEIKSVADFKYFLNFAKQQGLDPIKGEVVPSYRWNSVKRREMMTPLVTIGVLRKRRATECDGLDQFKFEHSEALRTPVSASGTIYRKGCSRPFSATVYFDEYAATDRRGEITQTWLSKGHMWLSKCLEAQLTRLAFYDLVGDCLIEEETLREEAAAPAAKPAAAADEFVVGEKPAPAAETKAPVAETKAPVAETKAPVAEAKTAPAETKAPVVETAPAPAQEKKKETKAPITPIGTEAWRIVSELPLTGPPIYTEGEVPQKTEQSAGLRAQALANQYGKVFYIQRTVSGVEKDLPIRFGPPAKPAAAFGKPAAPAEPAQPAAAPAPAAALVPDEEFTRLVGIMRGRVGGLVKDADKLIGQYFKAYLNLEAIPKDRPTLLPLLAKLVAAGDAAVADLKANPGELGARLAGRQPSALDKEFDTMQWPAPIRNLAKKVMALTGQDEATYIGWLGMPIFGSGKNQMAISQLDAVVLGPFFEMYLLVKGRAFEPIELAVSTNRGIAETMKALVDCAGRPVSDWDTQFTESVLDTLKNVTQPVTAPADDDLLGGGLPWN